MIGQPKMQSLLVTTEKKKIMIPKTRKKIMTPKTRSCVANISRSQTQRFCQSKELFLWILIWKKNYLLNLTQDYTYTNCFENVYKSIPPFGNARFWLVDYFIWFFAAIYANIYVIASYPCSWAWGAQTNSCSDHRTKCVTKLNYTRGCALS